MTAVGTLAPATGAFTSDVRASAAPNTNTSPAEAVAGAEQTVADVERRLGERHLETAAALLALGSVYERSGRIPDAEKAWLRRLAILEALRPADDIELAWCRYDLGRLYEAMHRYDEARSFYERALPTATNGTALSGERQALEVLVEPRLLDVRGMMGEDDGYIDFLTRTFEQDQGDFITSRRWFYALNLLRRGRVGEAEAIIVQGLDETRRRKGEDSRDYALVVRGLGNVYLQQARLAEAEPLLETALKVLETSGDEPAVANTLESLAALRRDQGRLDAAARLYERAMAIAQRTADPSVDTTALFGLSTVYLEQGRAAEAEPLLLRALRTHKRTLSEKSPIVAFDLSALSAVHAAGNELDKALATGREAIAIITSRDAAAVHGDGSRDVATFGRVFANQLQVLARLIAADPNNAAALLDEAFRTAQEGTRSAAGESQAKAAARLAARDPALADVVRSLQDLQNRWQTTTLLLSKVVGDNDADRVGRIRAELSRIEAEIGTLDRRLRDEFPQYGELARHVAVPIATARDALKPGEALVVLDVEKDKTFVFVVKADFAGLFVAAVTRSELAELVRTLRDSLDPKGRSWFEMPAYDVDKAHRLYRTLLGPAEDVLGDAAHLVVVASGPLQSLPPAVLVTAPPQPIATLDDYRTVPWLIRRHAVTVVPAVSSFVSFRRSRADRQSVDAGQAAFVGFGDPDFSGDRRARMQKPAARTHGSESAADALRTLPRLPETADELRAQAEALGASSSRIHLGAEATVTRVKTSNMSAARVISFATHGLIAGELPALGEPALAFTPPPQPTADDDGLLRASDVTGLRLNADFVVLSACNTASSDGTPGAEGFSGLAKAFFYAGARSLLVSHWPVNSRAAARITTGVFDAFAASPSIGRAEALRRSMLDLVDGRPPHALRPPAAGATRPETPPSLVRANNPFDAHPSMWAPFVLVGESF